jgi:flagellar hook-associated protein 1 FlgK
MGTLVSALNIAKEALDANQSALNITANNVANQNTAGYTREVANFSTQDTYLLGGYEQANGVTAGTPTSIRDRVLEQRVEQQTQASAQSSTLQTALNSVQSIFGLTATSTSSDLTALGTATDSFFSSLTALANAPSQSATRQGVLSAASTLSIAFNTAQTQLTGITNGLNGDALRIVGQVNSLLGSIAALNDKIGAEPANTDAGVLEDQRQVAIAQLSQYIGLDQITTANNGIELTTSNDGLLVAGGLSYQLNASLVNGAIQITAGPNNLDISTGLTGGSLGGTLEALNSSLPPIQNRLDTLAYSIATAVNAQNALGFDANGNAGQALFTIGTTSTGAAATIAVATNDPNLVAAAGGGEGSAGNTNASLLAALGTSNIAGGTTPDGYLASSLAQIGEAASNANTDSALQAATLTQLTTQRDSLSGVSLDEEASNLTQYQRSYQAASQLFSIIDTLFASVLNFGVVTSVS